MPDITSLSDSYVGNFAQLVRVFAGLPIDSLYL